MENWEAKLEKHWEAFLLYVWGLIALTGLYADVDVDEWDTQYPRDLTAEDILQELALREMERLSLEANPRRFVHIRVNGWRGLAGQPRLDTGLRHPLRLASGGAPTHLHNNFSSNNAALPAGFALRFRPGKMRSRDSP